VVTPALSTPGATYRDRKFDDHAGQPVDTVRRTRDDITDHVRALIAEILPHRIASNEKGVPMRRAK
jgi:hypothetical protein